MNNEQLLNALIKEIDCLSYCIGNPSAWEIYSEEGSEKIRKLHDIIQEARKEDQEFIYKEGEEPTIDELFKGEVIASIEGDNVNVCVKTQSGKEFNIYSEGESSISCVTEVEIWKPKKTVLSL